MTPPTVRPGLPMLALRLMINLVVPVLAYVLLRPYVRSDIIALVAGSAIPAAYTVGVMLWRRRLDAIGVFATVCFALGLLLVVATGGNELVFKLREEFWTGPLGLALLISALVGRPLLAVALRLAGRRNPQLAERASDPQARRVLTVTTGAIGVILLVHAVAITALALTTSTSTFLAVKSPVSLSLVGGGLAALVWWIRRQFTSRRPHPHPHPQGRQEHHAHHHDSQDGHHQRPDLHGVARRAG